MRTKQYTRAVPRVLTTAPRASSSSSTTIAARFAQLLRRFVLCAISALQLHL